MEKTRPALVIDSTKAKVVEISAGGMHSLYLTADGEVWSFGCNDEGALGRDTSKEGSEFTAHKVDLPKDCIRITAGDSHSAFLLSDGRVFACGSFRDSHGTMGLNMKGKQQSPIEVVPGEEFVDIKSGWFQLPIIFVYFRKLLIFFVLSQWIRCWSFSDVVKHRKSVHRWLCRTRSVGSCIIAIIIRWNASWEGAIIGARAGYSAKTQFHRCHLDNNVLYICTESIKWTRIRLRTQQLQSTRYCKKEFRNCIFTTKDAIWKCQINYW